MGIAVISIAIIMVIWVFITHDTPETSAEYVLPDGGKIVYKLESMHPFLSEYKRYITVKNNTNMVTKELFPDTGGYCLTNLYNIGVNRVLVRGYHDSWFVDTNKFTIEKQEDDFFIIGGVKPEFIGAFDKDNVKSIRFIEAKERKEKDMKL